VRCVLNGKLLSCFLNFLLAVLLLLESDFFGGLEGVVRFVGDELGRGRNNREVRGAFESYAVPQTASNLGRD